MSTEKSKTASPFGLSGDKITKDVTDSKFTLRRMKDRCRSDCKSQKSISVRTSRNLLTAEAMENGNMGGTEYDLSTDAFFAGVQGSCTMCNGLVRTVVSGNLPVLGGSSVADSRDICRNKLFAATEEDLSNPMRTDYNLDDDMERSNADDDKKIMDGIDSDGLDSDSVRRHGSTVCLGVVNELEDRMRSALEEHGFATSKRARLLDLVRLWKSHSNRVAPKAMGRSICKRFIHCNNDELGGDVDAPDKTLLNAKKEKASAQATLARMEGQITEIDAHIKKMPKDEQANLKSKKTQVRYIFFPISNGSFLIIS